MVAFDVHDIHAVSQRSQVQLGALDDWVLRVIKVDGYKAAHRARHLVHQTARLAEVAVFCLLTDLCNQNRRKSVIIVQAGENGANQNLKGSGGGKSRTAQHLRADTQVHAAAGIAFFTEDGSDAADEGRGGVDLVRVYAQVGQVDLLKIEALGLDAHTVAVVFGSSGNHIQIDAGSNYAAALMVGVVAADFSASGCAEQPWGIAVGKQLVVLFEQTAPAFPLMWEVLFPIQGGHGAVEAAGRDCIKKTGNVGQSKRLLW